MSHHQKILKLPSHFLMDFLTSPTKKSLKNHHCNSDLMSCSLTDLALLCRQPAIFDSSGWHRINLHSNQTSTLVTAELGSIPASLCLGCNFTADTHCVKLKSELCQLSIGSLIAAIILSMLHERY